MMKVHKFKFKFKFKKCKLESSIRSKLLKKSAVQLTNQNKEKIAAAHCCHSTVVGIRHAESAEAHRCLHRFVVVVLLPLLLLLIITTTFITFITTTAVS